MYAGSTYADLYHEGWHAFSQLFLTVDQKKELYNEVRKTQPSLKNATDLQVEEHLAEDFRKYALAKGENIKSGSPVRNTLFRKIWNFLKSLFTGQTISDVLSDYDSVPAVRELYEKLYVGNLNEYRPSINNMMFTGLNLGITANANDAEQVLNYNDSLVVSDSIDSIMSNMLQDERNLGGVSLIFENEAAKNWLYLAVKNDFKEIIKSIQEKIKDQPEEAVQKELNDIKILQIAVDNWDSVLKFHKKKSVLLDFKGCATGVSHSVQDLCEYVFSKLDLNWREYVKNDYKFHRPEELNNLKGDSFKLRELTDWKPEYTFESMLDEMIKYWVEKYENKN